MRRIGSLFSGIGGIELGFHREGFETKWFIEKDKNCQRVLAKNFPSIPIYDDITTVDFRELEQVDILTGGFPCQDISIAGRKQGINGKRSGLWKEYLRAIRIIQPRIIVVENVARLLRSGIWVVLEDLAKEGYDAEWQVLRAQDFKAPHKRERVFIIAYPHKERADDGCYFNEEYEFCKNEEWDLAQNIKSGSEWERWLNEISKADNGQISQADFCGVDDGLPKDIYRIGMLGNAVVPQVAQFVAKRIKYSLGVNFA